MGLIATFIFLILLNNLLNNRRFTRLECTIEKLDSRINELTEKLSKYE